MATSGPPDRALPEPGAAYDPKGLLLGYLDFFRETIIDRIAGLSDVELRSSRLPSGWSPLALVKHLAYMERRWVVWGFRAEAVPDAWGDDRAGRWHVDEAETLDGLAAMLRAGGARTRQIADAADLSQLAATGGRFGAEDVRPTLGAILFHVLQEYARHAGHLDIVRELVDGRTGE